MDISDTPYYQKLIASSKLIGETIAPSLDVVNAMQPAIEQAKRIIARQDALIASRATLNDPFIQIVEKRNKSIANMIPTSVFAIQKQLDSPSFNIAKKMAAAMPKPYFSDISKITEKFVVDMSKYDFRVGVATQELEKAFASEPEVSTKNLLFKDTSNPSDEFEAKFFDILNEQRKVLDDSIKLFEEINTAKNKDITNEPSEKQQDSPAFYKDKMWYAEEIASDLLSLVVSAIFVNVTLDDPSNTLIIAFLLGCLLRFIKPNN
ncbi:MULTISPECIES: hypothetical protein [Enterococcus]|uniref:hypothetical protein n=1 Tax=Enterococcus TaxID=1350 RepID=UPI0001B6F91C|nr:MULTISPECIES: hypothetical protein [Enterococcus]EEV54967.1 predicted protein [Enterococcus faecium 1,231,410]EFR66887.1 hypothetical protein HMPREF9524_02977 [Enterococcus faecium TX0133a01]EFR70362.1 hypothetical protein HMPREF9526_02610 [Enterococcus faecium TX0133B]EFR74200.1 hypothetical protein HMPREF9523_01875 [Enterococcus faecium TX0133A]EFR77369.1 hypothetical protein HMPREF9527_01801 [Enterococcus faecium TX0133C]